MKTPLILRKIFQNLTAERGSLLLKVGEFTMYALGESAKLIYLENQISNGFVEE